MIKSFSEYSGAHAIGYFDSVGFEFLKSEHVQLRARNLPSRWWKARVIEMPKRYRGNADEMLNTICQKADATNQMLKKLKHDLLSTVEPRYFELG